MVGLGRMGAGMRDRLRSAGHEVIGYDIDSARSDVGDLAELVARLRAPRHVWVMVPAGPSTRFAIEELSALLEPDDVLVDGGNTRWTDDEHHARVLAEHGVRYLDCGVSGGLHGARNGYALMCGGDEIDVARMMPVFDALRPEGPRARSFVHAGPVGAGHFAKMVHNGIEYGLMQSLAEGYHLLDAGDVVSDVPGVLRAWTQGSVVRSWLLDLLVAALDSDPGLGSITDAVADSGEGRWMVQEAIEQGVPTPVVAAALNARFGSGGGDSPSARAVAALRQQFGGHQADRHDRT